MGESEGIGKNVIEADGAVIGVELGMIVAAPNEAEGKPSAGEELDFALPLGTAEIFVPTDGDGGLTKPGSSGTVTAFGEDPGDSDGSIDLINVDDEGCAVVAVLFGTVDSKAGVGTTLASAVEPLGFKLALGPAEPLVLIAEAAGVKLG